MQKNIDEVVLYHGSLAELNSRRDKAQQFKFADKLTFKSHYHHRLEELYRDLGKILRENGYDGLVNMQTIAGNFSPINTHISSHRGGPGNFTVHADTIFVEGTPIIRVRE